MEKRKVYLNEYNVLMDNTIYLPLSCGQLQAYAQTNPLISESYEFAPFIFIRERPEQILSRYHNPAVAGFSASMWNINLDLKVAQIVKQKFPNCLVVFGGPQVPLKAEVFLHDYPFIDVTVRGEGEQTFAELLVRLLQEENFKEVQGISYRKSGKILANEDRPLMENLNIFPSPYLKGVFDLSAKLNFQAIVETSRGCPFHCSFCFWGQGKHYRHFSLERVQQVAEWCGTNKIKYVFCADSNFGTFQHDLDIASYFVAAKVKYGFPEKFRATFGKNAGENIYRIGKLLTEHNMEKGITLSTQSNDPQTLANVGRRNIKLSAYKSLRQKYGRESIPVYSELILGLPGESYSSFVKGMEELLDAGAKNQVFVYICQVYPNTELNSKEYRDRFDIRTLRIPLSETHASVHSETPEYEEIVVSTASMPVEDWKRALVISWIMQLLHGLKLGFHVLNYLVNYCGIGYIEFFEYIAQLKPGTVLGNEVEKFWVIANSILLGKPQGVISVGSTYWAPEEAAYLSIAARRDEFFEDLYSICQAFCYNEPELRKAVDYQKCSAPSLKDYQSQEDFAREVVLYGRKSGRMLKEEEECLTE